jgi:LmbE family N-acetylglucosaminyl deacetylase
MAESKGPGRVWEWERGDCAVIVAHPDDETLWAGGTILLHPESRWTVLTICRKSDEERAQKFERALEQLNATGLMGDLDDGPEQRPLDADEVEETILSLLSSDKFDLIVTHGLWGEYTRHLRHEETSRAVMSLFRHRKLSARRLWVFAYEDGGGRYLPRPVRDAEILLRLSDEVWQRKYDIITKVYGFGADSFEAKIAGRVEAFNTMKPRS